MSRSTSTNQTANDIPSQFNDMEKKVTAKSLSQKEYEVIEAIRRDGKWKPPNDQNKTLKKLVAKGLVDFNESYSAIILTQKGKEIDL